MKNGSVHTVCMKRADMYRTSTVSLGIVIKRMLT